MTSYTSKTNELECTTRIEEVSEYQNATRGMVSNDILEYGRPGDLHNNYTSGYGVEVNPEIHKFNSTKKLI